MCEEVQKKNCSFRTINLCEFVDAMFYEITETQKESSIFIRNEKSIRDDLKRWGVQFGVSSSIYFEGHERDDVVLERLFYVDYFLSRKDNYYTTVDSRWVSPKEKPCVLIFHDESTFRCGEQQANRWFIKGKEPFISKGKGRSLMVSDFLVSHPTGPFFSLNDNEWKACIEKYPEIIEYKGVNYVERTCTGSIQPGHDNYFNSETILQQFERLFQMLQFKNDFNYPVKHNVEIVVDNARTHTAQVVNINEFRLNPGGNCPTNTIQFTGSDGLIQTINCFDDDGVSKGLKKIATELGYDFPSKFKLKEIKEILIEHPAFSPVKKLTHLAEKYGYKIIYCPKFHCELNPIEGLWCNQKCFIRKRTDQTFLRLLALMEESRRHFIQIELCSKLLLRFWNCLEGYKNNESYSQIITKYFSGQSKGKNKFHTKISNSQLL